MKDTHKSDTRETKGSSVSGTCALCLNSKVELQSSHFIPAGVYRLCRTEDTLGNTSPLFVAKGVVVQTDRQRRAHLLCRDCEQRFNKLGEKWIFANGIQKQMPTFAPFVDENTFPFLAKLKKFQPRHSSANVKFFTHEQVDPEARETLAYFAASMFWRGSVYPWGKKNTYPVRLGPYKEAFRRFLHGESGFPENAALSITVREPSIIWKHTHEPISTRVEGANVHKFVMPGFVFHMWVGKDLATWIHDVCFVRGLGAPLGVGTHLEQGIGETASGVLNVEDGAAKLQALIERQSKHNAHK